MKTAIATACMLAGLVTTTSAQTINGRYQVIGKNFDGSSYAGTAQIVTTSNNTCRINWVTGATSSSGICMRNGTSFAAAYVLGKAIGLVIYNLQADGSLEGLWTIADQDGVGHELLVPRK